MGVFQFDDYRDYLASVLERRCQTHSKYSQRSFARDLRMSSSRLNQVLSKKKGISLEGAVQISRALGLEESEMSYFCDLVQLAHTRSEEVRALTRTRLGMVRRTFKLKRMNLDLLKIISDWAHFAILELTYLKAFQANPAWIARKLSISEIHASRAFERLVQTGLIEKKNGRWIKKAKVLLAPKDRPSSAARRIDAQMLAKARTALDSAPRVSRHFQTTLMAIDPDKLEHAKREISKLRLKICDALESGDQREIYCYSTQLFRVDQAD